MLYKSNGLFVLVLCDFLARLAFQRENRKRGFVCLGSLRLTQVLQSWNHFTTCFISLKTETLNSRLLWWVKSVLIKKE